MAARALALACLLAAGLAGCADEGPDSFPTGLEPTPSPSQGAQPPADDGLVAARVLLNSTIRGVPFGSESAWEPTRLAVRIQDGPDNWTRGWPHQFTRPDIQFGGEFVATLGWGPFNETGAHVEVARAGRARDGQHVVDLVLVHPGPGCVVGKAPMAHVQWIAFPRSGPVPANLSVSTSERVGPPCQLTRPDRLYHVLSLVGEVTRSPPYEGPMPSCGRIAAPFGGLDTVNRQAYVATHYGGHDFNWTASWLVVHSHIDIANEPGGCGGAFIRAYEGPYNQTFGSESWPVEVAEGGLRVGDRTLAANDSRAVRIEYTVNGSQNGSPITWTFAGDATYRYYGAWRVRDIVEVGDEGNTWGDLRGYWGGR